MKTYRVWILFVTVFLASITPIMALAVPPQPYVPYGTVKFNDEQLPVGTQIIAYCDGIQAGVAQTKIIEGESWYSIDVLGDDPVTTGVKEGCSPGEKVTFSTQSIVAEQEGVWRSGTQRLDLTFYKPLAKIAIEKRVNGQDADSAPGPYLLVGTSLTWTYVVTNIGEMALSNVIVVDDNGTPGNTSDDLQVCGPFTLAIGASQTCSLAGTAQLGQYVNIATATGTPPEDPPVSASDPAHYFGASPGVAVEFKVNGNNADSAPGAYVLTGSTLTLDYVVSNTGNVALTNLQVKVGESTICTIPNLAAGATDTTTCRRTITALEGQRSASATVTATPPGGLANITSPADWMYYFGASPGVAVEFKVNGKNADSSPGEYVLTGSSITLDYAVSNTGNVALTNLVVKEGGTTVCTIPSLAVGATDSATCRRTITAQAGQQSASATVTATPPGGLANITSGSDGMYYFGATINVTFVKRTNGEDAKTGTGPLIGVGGAVDWTYTITSSSNVSLPFTVVDNPVVPISCSKNTLNPTDEVVCTATGVAVAGQYSNTATLTVTRPGSLGNLIMTDTSHYYGVITGITIEKRTNGFDADDAPGPLILIGENITWRYEITNTGNVDLTDVSVVDDKEGAITTCPTTIAGGATVTCTKMGTAGEGQYSNQATVTGNPPAGFDPVTDSDSSHYYGSEAGVAIKKLTNGVDTSVSPPPNIKLGDPVSWTYQVTNIGLYTITGLAVTDSDETLVISCPGSRLEPDESMSCSASGTAKAGAYTNTGYAEGIPEGLEGIVGEVGDSDESGYFGVEPLIEISKTTNDEDAQKAPGVMIKVGEPVTWRYEITNTGNVDLTDVSLVDDQEGPITCPATSLAVGITMTCSAQGTAIAGQYTNNATVTANTSPVEFGPVTDSDQSNYFGYTLSLDLVKRTNGQLVEAPPGPELEVGSAITWTFEVTNTSNVDLTSVSVVDDQEGPITCPATSLAAGMTMTCSAQGTAIAGQYSNNATVTANTSPVEFGPVTDSDRSYYFGYTLSLDLVKRTNGQLVEAPPGPELEVGSTVTWTYEVTNTSNVPLADIEIEDDMEGTITCPPGELGVGQSITCSTTGTVADGEYRNEAFASGKYGQDSVQSSIAISYYIGTSGFSIYLPLILR